MIQGSTFGVNQLRIIPDDQFIYINVSHVIIAEAQRSADGRQLLPHFQHPRWLLPQAWVNYNRVYRNLIIEHAINERHANPFWFEWDPTMSASEPSGGWGSSSENNTARRTADAPCDVYRYPNEGPVNYNSSISEDNEASGEQSLRNEDIPLIDRISLRGSRADDNSAYLTEDSSFFDTCASLSDNSEGGGLHNCRYTHLRSGTDSRRALGGYLGNGDYNNFLPDLVADQNVRFPPRSMMMMGLFA